MVISRGDVFWAGFGAPTGSEPASMRPVVIVQRDSINRSRFNTVLVVPLTSQTHHAGLPGNVLLGKGEGNLPKASLARSTHVTVIDRARLGSKIGTLPAARVGEIVDAISWAVGE